MAVATVTTDDLFLFVGNGGMGVGYSGFDIALQFAVSNVLRKRYHNFTKCLDANYLVSELQCL